MSDLRNEQLALFSALFTRTDKASYEKIVEPCSWAVLRATVPQDLASILAEPPVYEDYRHFINCMLTPGVPGAVPPVESLYKEWGAHRGAIQYGQGFYLGDSARHVRAIYAYLGIEIPDEYQAMPDHLVLLLELFEYLRAYAPAQDTHDFAAYHFDWLADYRSLLTMRAHAQSDARIFNVAAFYEGVLDCIEDFVAKGVRACAVTETIENVNQEECRSAEEVVLQ